MRILREEDEGDGLRERGRDWRREGRGREILELKGGEERISRGALYFLRFSLLLLLATIGRR